MSHIRIPCTSNYCILQNLVSKAYVKEVFDANVVMFFQILCNKIILMCLKGKNLFSVITVIKKEIEKANVIVCKIPRQGRQERKQCI